MLIAENLCKQVETAAGSLTILNQVNMNVAKGESLAIIGASGSGKSTLLGILAGLDGPSSGRVLFQGEDITSFSEEQRAKVRAQHVGFVFQSFQLLPGLTALENVMMPLELHGESDARGKAEFFLTRVGLKDRMGHYPKQLSGGEQQRVAIARAFASHPDILFADEPTGNLDTATGAHIIDLLFEMNREHGTTLVLVTHEQRLAERCQQRLVLEAGEVVTSAVAEAKN
jgi:putative ABC transport system ATP-binding protein